MKCVRTREDNKLQGRKYDLNRNQMHILLKIFASIELQCKVNSLFIFRLHQTERLSFSIGVYVRICKYVWVRTYARVFVD